MDFKTIETVTLESFKTVAWEINELKLKMGLPVAVPVTDDGVIVKIEELVKKHGTESPLHGNGKIKMLYLKSECLSNEILKNRFAHIQLDLRVIGILTATEGERYLCFKAHLTVMCPCDSHIVDHYTVVRSDV